MCIVASGGCFYNLENVLMFNMLLNNFCFYTITYLFIINYTIDKTSIIFYKLWHLNYNINY